MTRFVRGLAISQGIGYGKAILWTPSVVAVPLELSRENVDAEIERFRRALVQTRDQLENVRDDLVRMLGQQQAFILDAQIQMLTDPSIVQATETRIRKDRINAEWALELTLRDLQEKFQAIEDLYLRERWLDVRDVIRRIQANLMGARTTPFLQHTEPAILVAQELTPADLIELIQRVSVQGIVTTQASSTSHVAILSRSLRIPAVASVEHVFDQIPSGQSVLVDGYDGVVIVDPTPVQIREYEGKRRYFTRHLARLLEQSRGQASTLDGHTVTLRANIEFVEECEDVHRYQAEGIGLFRSEYLFLRSSHQLPTEDDHYAIYRRLVETVAPHPVVVRAADLGADRMPALFQEIKDRENNPVLGLRAIRLGLKKPELWEPQIAGMLRAAAHGDLRILIPFVATVEEVYEFMDMLDDIRARLRRRGVRFRADPPIGIMVEIPAMARMVQHLAGLVQFISVGTNDLIQYLLAVDRDHGGLRYLYKPYHPAVLQTVYEVLEGARRAGLPVSVCGEMAWDILSVPLLVGMGCPEMSMAPQWIPAIRFFIQELRRADAEKLLEKTLEMSMGMEVEETLLEWIQQHFPEGIYHQVLRSMDVTSPSRRSGNYP